MGRNVVSGSGSHGIILVDSYRNAIQGNIIGLDITGTNRLGNEDSGIALVGVDDNTVGGCEENARNLIGTDATGTRAIGNEQGVELCNSGTCNNIIGGSTPTEGNVISGQPGTGVFLGMGVYIAGQAGRSWGCLGASGQPCAEHRR